MTNVSFILPVLMKDRKDPLGSSFHTGRHTFASTVTLSNNISLEVVSKMLGHTNTRMTTHYAKLVDKYIGEQMDKLLDAFAE